jgi:hypothetical protein
LINRNGAFLKWRKQMDENQFWASFWRSVSIVVASLFVLIGAYSINTSLAIERAIASGADPIRASCAIAACEKATMIALGLSK